MIYEEAIYMLLLGGYTSDEIAFIINYHHLKKKKKKTLNNIWNSLPDSLVYLYLLSILASILEEVTTLR